MVSSSSGICCSESRTSTGAPQGTLSYPGTLIYLSGPVNHQPRLHLISHFKLLQCSEATPSTTGMTRRDDFVFVIYILGPWCFYTGASLVAAIGGIFSTFRLPLSIRRAISCFLSFVRPPFSLSLQIPSLLHRMLFASRSNSGSRKLRCLCIDFMYWKSKKSLYATSSAGR